MASSEPGPELDRRVVELLGWQVSDQVRSAKGGMLDVWSHPRNGRHFPGEIPTYSTDPARIAEMHTWIAGKCATVAFWWSSIDREWGGAASATPVELIMSGAVTAPQPIEVVGKTIEHALALLVVAVGEAT